ncbi:zinc-binding dehydrogenase [Streptosporangium sp. CA-135522]|uniref:zinc-binding dehydrogenase n=1 Tax=Streptosporangium sp. CA-135522 TaxID=3240072 RepID=UPI003D8D58E8
MKALLPTGGTEATVAIGEDDHPEPRADEALVKVEAFSVNRGETFQLEAPRSGWRPGKDIAGLVVQAAADGSGPAACRRVVGHPPAAGWAEITAVTSSAERGGRLTELGAAAVIHDLADADGTYDLVLESTGGENLPLALARLARRGALIWFGQAGRRPVTLDFFDFFKGPESATLRHFHYADSDTPYGEDLATLVRLVATGRLHPELGLVADWAETAHVLTELRERRIRGNAVLTIS